MKSAAGTGERARAVDEILLWQSAMEPSLEEVLSFLGDPPFFLGKTTIHRRFSKLDFAVRPRIEAELQT